MKNFTKFLIAVAFVCGFAFTASSQIYLGPGLTYQTDYDDLGIQARLVIPFTDQIFGEADFNYIFTGEDITSWALNANGQYLFSGNEGSASPYALGGLNLTGVSVDYGGSSSSNTEIGLNLGVGSYFRIPGDNSIFADVKYVIGDIDRLVFGAGILFQL